MIRDYERRAKMVQIIDYLNRPSWRQRLKLGLTRLLSLLRVAAYRIKRTVRISRTTASGLDRLY